MDAAELITLLAGKKDARSLPSASPFANAVRISGIDVAHATTANERSLRRAWATRHGGGAIPLLIIVDDAERPESVLCLGPVDNAGAIRSVKTEALARAFDRLAPLPRLDAIRELVAELERLDQSGIPGLKVRDLLTTYTLANRLRRDAIRWGQLEDLAKAIPRGADWRATLAGLGYEIERRKLRGYLVRWQGRPVAVVHPKKDPVDFARLDPEGRPPEGALLNDCATDGAAFGLMATGGRVRLFDAAPTSGSASARYLDLDSGALQDDDRPYLALLSPAYLQEGQFKALEAEARSFGVELRKKLDDRLRQSVLPALGRALGRRARDHGQDLSSDPVREELERAALTLLFRAMFVLYCESAGYLPMDQRSYHQRSLIELIREAADAIEKLDERSTALWDGFVGIVKAMRSGNTAWGVPEYNGALFAPDGFDGAATLERLSLSDPDFGRVLVGLGRDPDTGDGIDYSTLDIGHLGHIYEGLLSLRLSVTDTELVYDDRADRYRAPERGEEPDVGPGDLLWQTHEGGRKGGGVYYTRAELVRHLMRQAVVPAFERHLERVREQVATDPAGAAETLFDFAVLDPACGSAHFLVVVVNELADMIVRFLAETPLPRVSETLERLRTGASAGAAIDDVALIRRLALKRCVYGVDLSLMGAEIAKLSLWLASFVPGLSLAYLDRNVQVGNSLVGVVDPKKMLPPEFAKDKKPGQKATYQYLIDEALERAAQAATRAAEGDDRTKSEVEASEAADAEARAETAAMERLFDLWTGEPFGLAGARYEVELRALDILGGAVSEIVEKAVALRLQRRFLHWMPAFPRVFRRDNPGFDAVIGNPPWNEVTVEELAFYAQFRPGLRNMAEAPRKKEIEKLLKERPDLSGLLEVAQAAARTERAYLSSGEYDPMAGDPDLYKYFCQRYRALLRPGGSLGVVLPRSTFVTDGSRGFREWLFERNTCERVDFLLNSGRWAFDSEPRYTVALVAARTTTPDAEHRVRVAGTAASLAEWEAQAASDGLALEPTAFGPAWTSPLLRTQAEADLLARLRRGSPFPRGSDGRWRGFPVRELDETNDRSLWEGKRSGWPLWKGESFDQYDPRGTEARPCPKSKEVMKKVLKPRPGAGSILAGELPVGTRKKAVETEVGRARVAFRDVTRATDSRSVRACLVPPETFLTNKAPYLALVPDDDRARAACLGIMNSLPFDWQARRFVEINLNFFILEGLVVPDLSDDDYGAVAEAAARLSCVDDRFTDFAKSIGVECGPLKEGEHNRLRIEIDARIARAWNITPDDLDVLLADFTTDAVPASYREALRSRLAALAA